MGWEQIFSQAGEAGGDQFGSSVSISGNYAIVGASAVGKAYWFERQSNGEWKQVHSEEGEETGDNFGDSVAIDGNYAIVGAPTYGTGISNGKAYWFERQSSGVWKQIHSQEGGNRGDFFGKSVSISGNYSIVGAYGFDGGESNGRGIIHFYERQSDGRWREILCQEGENRGDFFGQSVSISGNYAIVGAIGSDPNVFGGKGKSYWYERQSNGEWKQISTQTGENGGDGFGSSVAIRGNYAIVGANEFNEQTGRVYWFERQFFSGNWKQVSTQDGENTGDLFGSVVAIDGYAIVATDQFGSNTEGKAYIYIKNQSNS